MIITKLSEDDKIKLNILERAFQCLSKEELENLVGQELVVGKLKAEPQRFGPITTLALDAATVNADAETLKYEVMALRTELFSVKNDFSVLLKFINEKFSANTNMYNSIQSDFNTLKNKHGIY